MVINSLTLYPVTSNFKFMLNKSEFPILPLTNYILPFLSLSCYFFIWHVSPSFTNFASATRKFSICHSTSGREISSFMETFRPSLSLYRFNHYFLLCATLQFFYFIVAAAAAKSLQSRPTLCDPIDGSPSGSPVPGILQARTLEWVAISFSNAWNWKVEVFIRLNEISEKDSCMISPICRI